MKLTPNEVYVVGRQVVDDIRHDYYAQSNSSKSIGMMIERLQRVKSMYEEVEKNLDKEIGDLDYI